MLSPAQVRSGRTLSRGSSSRTLSRSLRYDLLLHVKSVTNMAVCIQIFGGGCLVSWAGHPSGLVVLAVPARLEVSFEFELSWWDIFDAFPGERNGQKNVTGLAKIVLANVALILEHRLLTKKESVTATRINQPS
jgi:hypothetical protein